MPDAQIDATHPACIRPDQEGRDFSQRLGGCDDFRAYDPLDTIASRAGQGGVERHPVGTIERRCDVRDPRHNRVADLKRFDEVPAHPFFPLGEGNHDVSYVTTSEICPVIFWGFAHLSLQDRGRDVISPLHHYPVQRLAGGVADPVRATGFSICYPLRTPHRNEGFRRIPRRDADAQKCHALQGAVGRAGGFRRGYHDCKNRVTPSLFSNRPASSSRRSIAGEVSSSRLASTLSRTRRAYSRNPVSRGRAFAIFGVNDFVCDRRRLVVGIHKRNLSDRYTVSRRRPLFHSCNHAACNPRDVFKFSSFLAHSDRPSWRSLPCPQQSTESEQWHSRKTTIRCVA